MYTQYDVTNGNVITYEYVSDVKKSQCNNGLKGDF